MNPHTMKSRIIPIAIMFIFLLFGGASADMLADLNQKAVFSEPGAGSVSTETAPGIPGDSGLDLSSIIESIAVVPTTTLPSPRGAAAGNPVVQRVNPDKIGVYRDGVWYLDVNDDGIFDTGDAMYSFGAAGWSPVVGDWDGSGAPEIGVYRNGVWYLDSDGDGRFDTWDLYCSFGASGWTPVVGNWDIDGETEIGVYRNGIWYRDMDNDGRFDSGDQYCNFGAAGWTPVVGDWDGDYTTEIGVWQSSGGATPVITWYLDSDNDGIFDTGDVKGYSASGAPVVGDWDGDVDTEVGVYLASGTWILDVNGNGPFGSNWQYFSYGAANYGPIVGDWDSDYGTEIGVVHSPAYADGIWYLDKDGDFSPLDTGDRMCRFGGYLWTPVVGRWF